MRQSILLHAGAVIARPTLFAVALPATIALSLAAPAAWQSFQRVEGADNRATQAASGSGGATCAQTQPAHPVIIHAGPETPSVFAVLPGHAGEPPARIACSTCHATRIGDITAASASDLTDFHQGLQYRHGGLSCLSCHNASNYDTLRRADGTALAYPDVMQLCAQCHGPQYRDYREGSHGGMTGHWDLATGPRERNTCTDCHDAHGPAYPRVQPVFPPQDRGAHQQRERAASHNEEENESASH